MLTGAVSKKMDRTCRYNRFVMGKFSSVKRRDRHPKRGKEAYLVVFSIISPLSFADDFQNVDL
jgi:hypothetical protein